MVPALLNNENIKFKNRPNSYLGSVDEEKCVCSQ